MAAEGLLLLFCKALKAGGEAGAAVAAAAGDGGWRRGGALALWLGGFRLGWCRAVANGDCQRFAAANKDDKLAGASDGSIDKLALQQHVLLHEQGNDADGVF